MQSKLKSKVKPTVRPIPAMLLPNPKQNGLDAWFSEFSGPQVK
jgi:hypothetical protein